jgi:c-di-AMP phosphodiesterase-like protein
MTAISCLPRAVEDDAGAEFIEDDVVDEGAILGIRHHDIDAIGSHAVGIEAVLHRVARGEQQRPLDAGSLQRGSRFVDDVDQRHGNRRC